MRNIHYADHLEKMIAESLDKSGIDFIHESEDNQLKLDFYLPAYDVFIEVKQYHSDRIVRQMESKDNVIAVQGVKSVKFLCKIINQSSLTLP